MGSWATDSINFMKDLGTRIFEATGKNEVNSYALEKEAYKNKRYIYMILGFGGFEDPAVIPRMYAV